MLEKKTILVTGCAGFIGSYLCMKLLNSVKDIKVIGIDNMNDYYDVSLKQYRLERVKELNKDFTFIKTDLTNIDDVINAYNIISKEINHIDYIVI